MKALFRSGLVSALGFLGALLVSTSAFAGWDGKVVDVSTGQEVWVEFMTRLLGAEAQLHGGLNLVLGENHYTPAIQNAQARVIRGVVAAGGFERNFTTAWEFLNYSEKGRIDGAFARFERGEIDSSRLIREMMGRDLELPYAPILEATKDLGGELLPVNLTRAEKEPVVKNGIGAVDPALLPSGFEMGGADYRERFWATMEGHAPPQKIENYFAAQCLTDDVMADHLVRHSNHPLRFLVVGHFHTDFADGVVSRIRARDSKNATVTIRWIDATAYTAAELDEQYASLLRDEKYGDVADYVYFVGEPQAD